MHTRPPMHTRVLHVHPCFARAIELTAHPKITLILSFSWGFSSNVAFCTPRNFICTPWVATMVLTGLEKSWNLTLDLKSHGILCWPGKMAFCLEKSLKTSGSHWKISCAMLNLIWTWKHRWLYDKKCHFVITFETILVNPCLQTCIAELLATLLQIAEPLVTL